MPDEFIEICTGDSNSLIVDDTLEKPRPFLSGNVVAVCLVLEKIY